MNLRKIVLLFLTFCLCSVNCQQDLSLECDEIDSEDYYDVEKPFCTISNFKVNHNQNVKIRNYSGWVVSSIKFMKFYESSLLYIPFKLFEEFPHLQTLDASATQILEITRNTFSSAGNLTFLNLAGNELTKISTSVFVGANSLLRLDLCHNKLEELSEFSFNGLKHLNSIMLCANQLKEIPSSLFKDNLFLNVVRLENNLLEHIAPEVFYDLFLLHEVNLIGNKLRTIDPNTFYRSYSLDDLFISTNRFTEFSLSNKSIMRHLEINENNLTSIFINGTKYVHAENNHISTIHMINSLFLESLFLAHNNISDIKNITKASGLLELSLSHNKIGQLNITTFDNLKRLRKLILRNIGLKYIAFGMFSKQVHLEVLDLSFNNLTTLNLDIFVPYMINLVQFYVDGNNLTEIQGKHSFAMAFQNLSTLGISQ
ncbi:leucine-rich repeat transmembrane neuronal protein 2-like, partial [Teleopsis dalmanni]|uniref:leucine-rich repeat transmembrane neuronal protein 2-like n=1 Tax=Teleopsis dalmanni TaxID=139649 RepID=UPI0018CD3FF8